MTVYVDNFLEAMVPSKWKGGGHMLASSLEELHAMADRIGLQRAWFQDDGTFPHYDLTRAKRKLAIECGATPIEPGDLPDDVLMKNRDGTYEPRHERMARRALKRLLDG